MNAEERIGKLKYALENIRVRQDLAIHQSKKHTTNSDELTKKLISLLEELKVNRAIATHQYEKGGRVKKKLITLVWDAVKNDIELLGDDLALTLRFAYGEVWRFNTIAEEYDTTWEQPLPNGDTVEAAIIDMAVRAIICLFTAEQQLSTYLAV